MSETTVTVGDTEVQIEETEDGFEATEVDESPESGLYIRGESEEGLHGFELPVGGDWEIKQTDRQSDPIRGSWNAGDDVSELRDWDNHYTYEFERGAHVSELTVVERE